MSSPLYRKGRKYAHLTAAGTEVLSIPGNPAWLHSIVPGNPGIGTITIYNNSVASGEVVAVLDLIDNPAHRITFSYDVRLDTGLTVVLSTDMDVTVIYE